MATVVVFLTSGTSYSRPSDWTDAGHTVELIGCGGVGGAGLTGSGNFCGCGGGGGAYLKLTYSSGALGSSTSYGVKTTNSSTTDNDTNATFWLGTTTTNTYEAQCGQGNIGSNAGVATNNATGKTNGTPSPVTYTTAANNGGVGNGGSTNKNGFGGGGAGGPSGAGNNGGGGSNTASIGGAGGAGANNGTAGATVSAGATGGAGGNGVGGSGGGTGSSSTTTPNGTAGSSGGGGGHHH